MDFKEGKRRGVIHYSFARRTKQSTMTASNQYDAEDTADDGGGDESMSYFDADGYLHHSESRELDCFDGK